MSAAVRPETARRGRLLAGLEERGLGALIVTDLANVRYLTGYVGSNGIAVLGREGGVLLTDSRYAVSAREQVSGVEVVVGSRDLLADVAARAPQAADGGRIGVEAENLTIARHERLVERMDGIVVEPTRGIVEDLRILKEPGEIETMRRAAGVVDRALERVLQGGIVGRSERDVAFALYGAMLEEGAEEPSFATIVGAGPNGARPHGVPGPDPIPPGTLVDHRPRRDRRRLLLRHDPHRRHGAVAAPAGGDLPRLPRRPGGGGRGRPRRHDRGRAGRGGADPHRRGGLR